MKKLEIYQGQKIKGVVELTGADVDKIKQMCAAKKEGYGFIALRGDFKHLFIDRTNGEVNPRARIKRGVVVSYKKDHNNEPFLAHDEYYFITDNKNKKVYGKIAIEDYKMVKVDMFFDAIPVGEFVDFGKKGVISSDNIEETLHYTNKKSLTNFFATVEIPSENQQANEI